MSNLPAADNVAGKVVDIDKATDKQEESITSVKPDADTPLNHLSTAQPPSFFLRWLSYLLLIPLVGLATIGFGCISLVCGLWDRSGRQQQRRRSRR